MSDKADGKTDGAGQAGAAGGGQAAEPTDPVVLANALRFEKAKNKVLLDEVTALEDEVVNRCMEDFDAVVSDETREFWREQLLTNRDAATAALKEMQRNRVAGAEVTRRPLHNRATARPVIPGQSGVPTDTDNRAVKIRNRAHEIAKTEGVPFSVAFRRAETEAVGQ